MKYLVVELLFAGLLMVAWCSSMKLENRNLYLNGGPYDLQDRYDRKRSQMYRDEEELRDNHYPDTNEDKIKILKGPIVVSKKSVALKESDELHLKKRQWEGDLHGVYDLNDLVVVS
jgi:hypothetical protein